MATCNDCFHFKACNLIFKSAFNEDNEKTTFISACELYKSKADVAAVKHRNPDDKNCVICNSELDEKSANGIWDLAGEICSIICPECDHDEQDTTYNLIRNYLETQNFCPACGARMDGGA